MSTRPDIQDDALIIAYLTGQATEAEGEEFQRRIAADPEFSTLVDELETWLAPLDEEITEVAPPEGLLGQIMNDISGSETVKSPAASTPASAPALAANDNAALKMWRATAIAASLIAIAAVALHLIPVGEPDTEAYVEQDQVQPGGSSLLALLSDDTPSPLVAIIYNPETGQVVARLSNVEVPDDGDLQLWLIRDGAPGPVSLGLLERAEDGTVEIESPADLNPGTDILAVSLEALGGSRSAGPEGPVLYTGAVTPI